MGRTVPTFTNIIDQERSDWREYRRSLPPDEQSVFDEVFRAAKQRLAANFATMRAVPFESIMMSTILEQRKLIRQLQDRIVRLEDHAQA